MTIRKRRQGEGPVVVERTPFNAETSMRVIANGGVTPNRSFYVRNHFGIPNIDLTKWKLKVGGAVRNPIKLTLATIKKMPCKTVVTTMECAGNGRSKMKPVPPGTLWHEGALGTASWTGVPMKLVLAMAGVKASAIEVLCRGADSGLEGGRLSRFERSLPIDEAVDENVILAFQMNGRRLPVNHGYPIRLIVPGWYGVASVKWLEEILLISGPFEGRFQTSSYIYSGINDDPPTPVTRTRVKSLITSPANGARVKCGSPVSITGLAWSGNGRIESVQVRCGNSNWSRAKLGQDLGEFAWRRWVCSWIPHKPGPHLISSKAVDVAGNSQPESEVFNELGYGYNTVTRIEVRSV